MPRQRSWTDEQLRSAIETSATWADVARKLGLAAHGKATARLRGHATRLEIPAEHIPARVAAQPVEDRVPFVDVEQIRGAVQNAASWNEVQVNLGLVVSPASLRRARKLATEAQVDTAHLTQYNEPFAYPPPMERVEGDTNGVGTQAEGAVLAALLRNGYNVLLPFGVSRYDVVFESENGFHRLQSKRGRIVRGALVFQVANVRRNGQLNHYKDQKIEYYGVHDPTSGHVYLVPTKVVAARKRVASLRVAPPENHQQVGITYADQFRLP